MKKDHRRLWLIFDRALAHNLLRQLAILVIVLVVALGLSYLLLSFSGAQWEEFCRNENLNKWLLPLYLLIDSNALNSLYMGQDSTYVNGWMLFASILTFLFGMFVFNGIIIGIITNSIEQRVMNHREGHIHYLKSGHYIIMGYDEMVPSFIRHIFAKDSEAFVLILTSASTIEIKEKLSKSFNPELMKRIILNYGHRTSCDEYSGIHLESAEQIYVVGNQGRSEHDAINVECLDSIRHYLEQKTSQSLPRRITCVFRDIDTYAAFKTTELFEKISKMGIEFVPYNVYSGWAKQVFVKRCYNAADNPEVTYPYPAVYGCDEKHPLGRGITPEDEHYVHLVFVGTTNFAVSFAMEAANVLHFPNFNRDNRLKTRITFIDINADKEMAEFITRNRHLFEVQSYHYLDLTHSSVEHLPNTSASLFNLEHGYTPDADCDFLDVEFEFIKGDIFSSQVQNLVSQWALDKDRQYLSIFLALSDQRLNFVMGMNMPDEVYDNAIPLFIRQGRSDNFVTSLRMADQKRTFTYRYIDSKDGTEKEKNRSSRYAHIYPFGMNETAYSEDNHSLRRAKLINYLYCTADYDSHRFKGILTLNAIPTHELWEKADEEWNRLSVALKWSNLYSAYAIRTKLTTLRAMRGLDIEDTSHDYDELSDYEVEEMAMVEHNRWNVEKLLMGYRKAKREEDKYLQGSHFSSNKKLFIHHDIRPYSELDIIRELDREFSRYIPWIMKMTETPS